MIKDKQESRRLQYSLRVDQKVLNTNPFATLVRRTYVSIINQSFFIYLCIFRRTVHFLHLVLYDNRMFHHGVRHVDNIGKIVQNGTIQVS